MPRAAISASTASSACRLPCRSEIRAMRSILRSAARQPLLVDLAHHGVGGGVDVADLVAHHLAEQAGRRRGAEAVVARPAVEHVVGGVLQRLVERTGIADREDLTLVLAARPYQLLLLFDRQPHLDLVAGLDAGADDLAVALHRMAVAEEEQRAFHRHREPD